MVWVNLDKHIEKIYMWKTEAALENNCKSVITWNEKWLNEKNTAKILIFWATYLINLIILLFPLLGKLDWFFLK